MIISMNKKLQNELKQKREKLEYVKAELKKRFFGIDEVIDKFISSIESWYFFPDLRTKPLVVNLWGITGVGKTALVRSFVELIGFGRKYCELTVSNSDTYYLSSVLEDAGITFDDQAILMIDEFQRLKSLNEKGEEIEASDLNDLWTFLSDGSFPVPFNLSERLDNLADDLDVRDKKDPVDVYLLRRVFFALRAACIDVRMEQLKTMKKNEIASFLAAAKDKAESYKSKQFSKVLVIVSGNLDEAFSFSKDVSDADTDPDLMSDISDDIKLTNIKHALTARFRPEQISRLGNIHIIYPVLSREAYNKLISRECERVTHSFLDKTGVQVFIDESLKEALFTNGVFPNQGVRPLFSSISMLLENPMSFFVTQAIERGASSILLKYDKDSYRIYVESESNEQEYAKYDVKMTLDEIRDNTTKNNELLYSVHEAGHAVTQALLFGIAPHQLTVKSSWTGTGGFCFSHGHKSNSKEQLLDDICVTMGGRAAELLAFGETKTTLGASEDIQKATIEAISICDFYGMNGTTGRWDDNGFFTRTEERDYNAHMIIEEQLNRAKTLLKNNKKFLIAIADALNEKGKLLPAEFKEIADKNGVELKVVGLKDCLEEDYTSMWNNFKKKAKKFLFF